MPASLKTTRPVRTVRTIEDIRQIEGVPYDEQVTAHTLLDLFRATAARCADAPALTVMRSPAIGDVGATYSHSALLAEITRAANMFRALDANGSEPVVAFLTPTLPLLVPLLMGAQVSGIAASLNYLLSRDALVDLLNAQRPTVLVVPARRFDAVCRAKAKGMIHDVPSLRHVLVIGDEDEEDGGEGYIPVQPLLERQDAENLAFSCPPDRDRVCAYFHTGGTTGRPKVVRLTHGNQIHAAFGFAQVFAYDEGDVVINGFPFFHVGGTMTVGLSVIAAGGHIVIPSPYALRPKDVIENYWSLVDHFGATVINGVPTSIGALTAQFPAGRTFPTVRMAATGGAVCPRAITQRFEETTGIRLFETYGMTETAAAIAFNPGRGEPLAGSAGFRAPYSELRIVSLAGDSLGALGPNESGLVQVRGPQVFPGYLDPLHDQGTLAADGWLTTGDIGYLNEGERLILTGREKDLIVRSGHNIDPAAIEDVANRFPSIEISAAVGMPDQYAGEVPILFVVPAPGASVDLDALREYLETQIFEPPARPKAVLTIDALPVTAVGKIFKPALRDLAIEEKVRQETMAVFSSDVPMRVSIGLDAHKRTIVEITIDTDQVDAVARLQERLQPLPQDYRVHRKGST